MDILQKITSLRQERGWNEYQLALKSGLRQSTISAWYRKGLSPTIASLQKVCTAFNITLSQLFAENDEMTIQVKPEHYDVLNLISQLTPEQSDALISFIDSLEL